MKTPADKALSKGEKTRERALDVAEQLFARNGFRGTSMREIAQGTGIQEPGLYRYFDGKDDIYSAVLDRALTPLAAMLQQELQAGMPQTGMATLPGRVLVELARHPHVAMLFQQAVLAGAGGENMEASPAGRWVMQLLRHGRGLLPSGDDGDQDEGRAVLRLLAMFNLCIGYFTCGEIIRQLSGRDPTETGMLQEQKRLLERTAASWSG